MWQFALGSRPRQSMSALEPLKVPKAIPFVEASRFINKFRPACLGQGSWLAS